MFVEQAGFRGDKYRRKYTAWLWIGKNKFAFLKNVARLACGKALSRATDRKRDHR
jgi:hypothetical protein